MGDFCRVLCVCLLVPFALVPRAMSAEHAAMDGAAVSSLNGKISLEGGLYDDDEAGLLLGSFSLPVSHSFGVQFDGALGTIDGETLGGGGVHFFTRDPAQYLLGVFGSYHTWDSIDIWRVAAEAELYLGPVTLRGLAGLESINVPETIAGLTLRNDDDEHFFTDIDIAYYLTDDLRVSAGYRYVSEAHLASVKAEYLLRGLDVPVSLFVESRFGEEQHNRITGGLRIFFSDDPGKSLIRRHREDDPVNVTPVYPDLVTNPPPPPPPPPPVIEEPA